MSTFTQRAATAGPREFEFGDPTPNAVGRKALVPHEGCVVHIEQDSAPRLMWFGEDLLSVKMPAGTRVMYPNPTIPGLPDRAAAIHYALAHPEEMEPLAALLWPGMKVTIAIDDISLPLPKMPRPDVRESVLTVLLERLAEKGIEDVHIIIATSYHRRMAPFEIRRVRPPDLREHQPRSHGWRQQVRGGRPVRLSRSPGPPYAADDSRLRFLFRPHALGHDALLRPYRENHQQELEGLSDRNGLEQPDVRPQAPVLHQERGPPHGARPDDVPDSAIRPRQTSAPGQAKNPVRRAGRLRADCHPRRRHPAHARKDPVVLLCPVLLSASGTDGRRRVRHSLHLAV
ncbi:MAG: hypothetical protein DMG23_13935 [Acidobacteria bacterium]|nr:MAG: hypothetical protein DMG23_13935 [Acidobacteriota bacterium]